MPVLFCGKSEDFAHVLSRRRTAGPGAANETFGSLLTNDHAKRSARRRIDGSLNRSLSCGMECRRDRRDSPRDQYVVLNSEVVFRGGVVAEPDHCHLARTECDLVRDELWNKTGVAKLNAPNAQWFLIEG